MMTEEMRKAAKEGAKLATLNKYPKTVVRYNDCITLEPVLHWIERYKTSQFVFKHTNSLVYLHLYSTVRGNNKKV
jgi:hypothetical protein